MGKINKIITQNNLKQNKTKNPLDRTKVNNGGSSSPNLTLFFHENTRVSHIITYLVSEVWRPLGLWSNAWNGSPGAQDLHGALLIRHVSQGEGDDDERPVDEDSVGEVLRHRHRVPVMELEKTNTRLDWYGNIATAK